MRFDIFASILIAVSMAGSESRGIDYCVVAYFAIFGLIQTVKAVIDGVWS
jgi:hypothetical protein